MDSPSVRPELVAPKGGRTPTTVFSQFKEVQGFDKLSPNGFILTGNRL